MRRLGESSHAPFQVIYEAVCSTSTTWCLFYLACHPKIQTKLREELVALSTDEPTMDQLNSLGKTYP
jgi:hypothetical protein